MKKTIVKLDITVNESDNVLLNDVTGMVARLVYILRRIPEVVADYHVTLVEEKN